MRKKVVLSLLCVPNRTIDLWNAFKIAAMTQGWTGTEISQVAKQVFDAPDYLAALEIIFDNSDTCAEGDEGWSIGLDGNDTGDYYNDGPGEKEDIYDRVI